MNAHFWTHLGAVTGGLVLGVIGNMVADGVAGWLRQRRSKTRHTER